MKTYSKESVTMYSGWNAYRRNGPLHPAINVKCYNFPDRDKIAAHYGKNAESPEVERVMTWLWESEVQSFWEMAQYAAEEIFGRGVKVHAEGRSGGYLMVEGLKDFDYWDAIDLAKWRKFERWIKGAIPKDNADWFAVMIETIDANEWLLTEADEQEKEREAVLAVVQEIG